MASNETPLSETAVSPSRPLAGVRVLSLAEQYPGPFATLILADLGADVILVERPKGGDPTRRFSGHFAGLNRNKRSVAIDLKSPRGKEVFLDLAATSDVVVEGFRPGVLDRLEVGPKVLRDRAPDLVVASISSFGQTGPLGARGGHDLSVQGIAGFVRGTPPAPAAFPLADLASGMFAAIGILASLLTRERGGAASHVDISMLDALVTLRATSMVSSLNGLDPAPYPPEDPGYGVFETAAGERITLSIAGEDHQWKALAETLGLDDVAGLTTVEREARADELAERLRTRIRAADWTAVETELSARGVGFGPVNDDESVADHAQVRARKLLVSERGGAPTVFVTQPIKFDGEGSAVTRPAPQLGEHTAELLAEVGYQPAEIADLEATGVIASSTKEIQ
jgi:crotonobetainyl-CoA:carnitine CoA-transferase CaiB-like acyl-CoA transferase